MVHPQVAVLGVQEATRQGKKKNKKKKKKYSCRGHTTANNHRWAVLQGSSTEDDMQRGEAHLEHAFISLNVVEPKNNLDAELKKSSAGNLPGADAAADAGLRDWIARLLAWVDVAEHGILYHEGTSLVSGYPDIFTWQVLTGCVDLVEPLMSATPTMAGAGPAHLPWKDCPEGLAPSQNQVGVVEVHGQFYGGTKQLNVCLSYSHPNYPPSARDS